MSFDPSEIDHEAFIRSITGFGYYEFTDHSSFGPSGDGQAPSHPLRLEVDEALDAPADDGEHQSEGSRIFPPYAASH